MTGKMPKSIARQAIRWLTLVADRAREVHNLNDHRYLSKKRHDDHVGPSANVLIALNAKITKSNYTAIRRQRRRDIIIRHMERSPVNKDISEVLICRGWCDVYTTKIKTIKVISHLVGGRGELDPILMVRQCLNSRDPVSTNGLN
jgi:hypothetical protein